MSQEQVVDTQSFDQLTVEIAQGVKVRVVRSSITQVLNVSAPVAANS